MYSPQRRHLSPVDCDDSFGFLLSVSSGGFLGSNSGEQDETDGSEPEHFHSGPDADEHDQVEPFGCPGVDDGGEPVGDAEVWHGQQHCWDAPFESSAGANQIADDVGKHPTAQKILDEDTCNHE